MSATAPADSLRARFAELTTRLRCCGGVPVRDREGGWCVNPLAPSDLVREWIALAGELDAERRVRARRSGRDRTEGPAWAR